MGFEMIIGSFSLQNDIQLPKAVNIAKNSYVFRQCRFNQRDDKIRQ